MEKLKIYRYGRREESLNIITHAVGALLAVAGTAVLVVFSALQRDPWKIVSSAVFGASMILLYSASALYHGSKNEKVRHVMNLIDHISIFYLIAGTYTPFVLVTLRGPWGWSLFGVVWGLTVAGTVIKVCFKHKLGALSLLLYLAMGWCIVIAIKPFVKAIDPVGLILTTAGGVAYSVGVIFYKSKKIPCNHGIWHFWVLAGTVLQYFAVLFYVILPTT